MCDLDGLTMTEGADESTVGSLGRLSGGDWGNCACQPGPIDVTRTRDSNNHIHEAAKTDCSKDEGHACIELSRLIPVVP